MSLKKDRFHLSKQQKQYHEHCCVPMCSASSTYNGVLSFHAFPSDLEIRKRWLVNIRREKFVPTPHTKVCSLHFLKEQTISPKTESGKRRLQRGAVPVLFQWNNYTKPPPRVSVWERVQPVNTAEPTADDQAMECAHTPPGDDHDYPKAPEAAFLDMALDRIKELEETNEALVKQLMELKICNTFALERFIQSEASIRLYTRFPNYRQFMLFWEMIEPAVHKMVRASRAKAAERRNEEVTSVRPAHMRQALQPIEELFLFLMYLSAGYTELDLANRFNISTSTVSRIICSWTNFLYTLLGSASIWMEAEDVKAYLPDDFKEFSDTQIIADCTELKCQTPSSPVIQSEMYSTYKSHCTMKALIGIAPHGPITFISSLYEGSISDKEVFRKSGLSDLLTEDVAIMVDKGFLINDLVKCKVYCPPFLKRSSQMSAPSVLKTQKIASLRVQVERVIRRIKENKIFETVVPLSIVGSINEMFAVACLLSNYQNKDLVKRWAK
ncbi:uncharacterized protein LOC134465590 [Engraulis encrasicolus]|uniref:uncharacterized protein LOC134465590 n=1 Tax=Engraulis encrasicolus TaxID=184585 RepID=UPI002FD687EE